ncbi:MAG TPA: hypothetical protein VHQ47_13915 [Phycisphaerae bacterium]|nr:hypothetical protein [Phycisphaerae bacterium]
MPDVPDNLDERIAAYLDGKLPPAEAARLEVYLANTDPALATRVLGMSADRHAVRSLPKVSAPQDLAARVMEQVERTALLNDQDAFEEPRRRPWRAGWALAAALALVIGGIGFVIKESLDARQESARWANAGEPSGRPGGQLAQLAPASVPGADTLEGQVHHVESLAAADGRTGGRFAPMSPAPMGAGTMAAPAAPGGPEMAAATRAGLTGNAPTRNGAPAIGAAKPVPTAIEGLAELNPAATPGQPLVLTLAARDEADFDRLRSQLDQWRAAGPSAAPAASSAAPVQVSQPDVFKNGSTSAMTPPDVRSAATASDLSSVANKADKDQGGQNEKALVEKQVMPEKKLAGPTTYHITLRPEQLVDLAREFHITALAQGGRRLAVETATFSRQAPTMDDGLGGAGTLGGRQFVAQAPQVAAATTQDFGAASGGGGFGGGGGGGRGAAFGGRGGRGFGGGEGSTLAGGGSFGSGGFGAAGQETARRADLNQAATTNPAGAPALPPVTDNLSNSMNAANARNGNAAPPPAVDCIIEVLPPPTTAPAP